MNSPFVEKIKNVIDYSVLKNFNISDMEYGYFAPIVIKNNNAYTIIGEKAEQRTVQDAVSLVLGIDNVKFRSVPDADFRSLMDYIKPHLAQNEGVSQVQSISRSVQAQPAGPVIRQLPPAPNVDLSNSSEVKLKYDDDFDDTETDTSDYMPEYTQTSEPAPAFTDSQQRTAYSQDKFFSKKIGEILVQMNFISQEQLFNALMEAKKTQTPLGTVLVQRNFITLAQLKEALKAQQGYETVSEEEMRISDDVLSMLPEDFIRMNKVLPINYNDKGLVVGMVNPNDKKVVNDIIFLTGLKPSIRIITYYEFSICVKNLFDEGRKATGKLARKIEKQALAFEQDETLYEQAQKELQDDSSIVVQFVNQVISTAIDQGVSDIHIEPRLDGYVVRYRKDGILRESLRLPARAESAILTRLKVISKMNIAEHRRPQDGSFSITYKQKDYDFRINTLPVGSAEKMVIRILAPAVSLSNSKESLNLVGASKDDIEIIKRMESAPNGIILATGPTGSGKTTTLYTLLKAINDEKINITTIEDPIEIRLDGINQSQINVKAGITFASCMRAILRQDPDVILVGEIRDIETLETAISAALTGHLVLSTVHTNSAASTITRLIDMGAKDYLVSSTLVGIVAQRLVRHLCPHCRVPYHPSREEAEMVVAGTERDIQEFMRRTVYSPGKCDKCNFEGYKGRLGVYEIMPVSKEIKKLISQGAHDIQIEEAAIAAGMNTLQQACLKHIIQGNTTISEFIRVLGPVKE